MTKLWTFVSRDQVLIIKITPTADKTLGTIRRCEATLCDKVPQQQELYADYDTRVVAMYQKDWVRYVDDEFIIDDMKDIAGWE